MKQNPFIRIILTDRSISFLLITVWLLAVSVLPSSAGEIRPLLQKELHLAGADDEIPVIIQLREKAALSDHGHALQEDKLARRMRIVRALRETAERTQTPVLEVLARHGAKGVKSLWLINGIAATVPLPLVAALADLPDVASVALDFSLSVPSPANSVAGVSEWNLNRIKAPLLWNLGITGQNVVVANMDTGVDPNHPDLMNSWRGLDPGFAATSWYDPHGEHLTPYDNDGHGTQTMSIMVGGSAGGSAIGVAPSAKWIAVKLFNDSGTTTQSIIIQGFQWLLNPDGNLASDDAPDIVNNSWAIDLIPNLCVPEIDPYIQTLKAAGIAVAFSAGNAGPNAFTSISPSNAPSGFAVGATDMNDSVAFFSSRGPSACDGRVFPDLSAPGVGIRVADLTFGGVIPNSYANVLGTSFSAPHVAGAMALLKSARPSITVAELETVLKQSARDLGTAGPDNSYGSGLLDVFTAYLTLNPTADKIGVYSSGAWYLDKNANGVWSGLVADASPFFGFSGSSPVAGAWSGAGSAGVGVHVNGFWYLDMNGNGTWDGEPTDKFVHFGFPGAVPVTGDWTGTGATKIGVYADAHWYLDANNDGVWNGTPTDLFHSFGFPGAVPVTGDWTGTGVTKIGVYAAGFWYLDMNGNGMWDGEPTDRICHFGFPGAVPVTGDWTGTGATKIGVYADSYWYLDLNGDCLWNGESADARYHFGVPGAVPVTGRW